MASKGAFVAFLTAAVLIVLICCARPALAVCPPTDTVPAPPLRATLNFKNNPPVDVTFQSGAQIALVLRVENCSGSNVLTTEGFSSTDFFRRLYFVDPNGQTLINTSEGGSSVLNQTLHGLDRNYFCQYRKGVAQNPSIPVVPVETLTGSPAFFREYTIDNVLTLYAVAQPGHYSVNARIALVTADTGDAAAILTDCDFFEGTTVVNVANPSHSFTVVSNTLEFVIAASTAVPANSTITGTGPVLANGTAESTVTITLQNSSNGPVQGITPTFLASGSDNTLGACSPTNASGISTCTLASTKAEVKTLSIEAPIVKAGGSVTFTAVTPDHLVITPATATVAAGSYLLYKVEAFDAANKSLGDVTAKAVIKVKGGRCVGPSCTAKTVGPHLVTATYLKKSVTGTLTGAAPLDVVKVWVGLANPLDTGIKFDLQAIVKQNGTPVALGQLASLASGAFEFGGARLNKIPLLALAGPVDLSTGTVTLELLVRNACAKSKKDTGSARLWYNGAKDDSGADKDAASRIDASAASTAATLYYLTEGFALTSTAGTPRAFIDTAAGSRCGAFQSFGVWTRTP